MCGRCANVRVCVESNTKKSDSARIQVGINGVKFGFVVEDFWRKVVAGPTTYEVEAARVSQIKVSEPDGLIVHE